MGISLISLHIYTNHPIDPSLGDFRCFSKGWQTRLPIEDEYEYSPAMLRKLSKKAAAPLLAFSIYDSDELSFSIYDAEGKRRVFFSTAEGSVNKGIFQIPGLVGYPEGCKRRISEILSCSDIDLLTEMLEEFFGAALLVDGEIAEERPEELKRCRGEEKYLAFHEEEKKLRGKHAPIRAVLAEEIPGKLFEHDFFDFFHVCAPGYYLYGYDREECNLRTVRFTGGRLVPAEENMVLGSGRRSGNDPRFSVIEYYPRMKITCSPDCPEAYRSKTFTMPAGFSPFTFDSKGRLILSNLKNSIAYMDPEGKITARLNVRGEPVDLTDDHLLTAGSTSFYVYEYDPKAYIRIFRLEDR